MQWETNVIKHLASKVTEEVLAHKFSENQRTLQQLLAYLAHIGSAATADILNDDGTGFASFAQDQENFDVKTFPEAMDKEIEKITTMLEATSEDKFAEEKTMFGRFSGTRGEHMFMVYNWYIAYKMQLFLQLKHAGFTELGTSNVWGGMDEVKTDA